VILSKDAEKPFNQLAREQMKLRLLADIKMDLIIFELEGWDKMEYLNDLKELIDTFMD